MTVSAFRIDFRIRRWWRRALVPHDHCGESSVTAQTLQEHHCISPIYVGIFSAPVVDINYSCCYHLGKLDYSGYVCSLQFFHLMNKLSNNPRETFIECCTLPFPTRHVFETLLIWERLCFTWWQRSQSAKQWGCKCRPCWMMEFFFLGAQMRALGLVKCRRLKTL